MAALVSSDVEDDPAKPADLRVVKNRRRRERHVTTAAKLAPLHNSGTASFCIDELIGPRHRLQHQPHQRKYTDHAVLGGVVAGARDGDAEDGEDGAGRYGLVPSSSTPAEPEVVTQGRRFPVSLAVGECLHFFPWYRLRKQIDITNREERR